ncbi:MAG: tetratricopeptide repeat protein [Candidatus Paceibacterales bacterium]
MDKNIPDLVLFYQYTVLVYLLFVALYLFSIVFLFLKARKTVLPNIFLFGMSILIFAPFYTNRFINLAPLVAMPAVGIIYSEAGKKAGKAMLVAAVMIAVLGTWARFTNFSFGLGISSAPFQAKVTNFLKASSIDGNIYASQEVGAFLSWNLPKSKVFIDTRDDLFLGTDVFGDLGNLDGGKIDIGTLLNKYGANIVVGDIGGGNSYEPLFYSNDWKVVFLTDGYFVAVRKSLIAGRGIKTYEGIDPFRSPAAKAGELDEAANELEYLVSHDSDSLENKFRLIDIKLAQNKPKDAKAIFETIKTGENFGGSNIDFGLGYLELAGRVYLAGGECKSAFAALDKTDKLSRGKLIFFPGTRLPTNVDKYWGEYYLKCAGDRARAIQYFNLYLAGNNSPLERRQIELELENQN